MVGSKKASGYRCEERQGAEAVYLAEGSIGEIVILYVGRGRSMTSAAERTPDSQEPDRSPALRESFFLRSLPTPYINEAKITATGKALNMYPGCDIRENTGTTLEGVAR